MRLKLDENLDPRAVGILHSAGHDVITLVVIGSHQGLSNVYLCSWANMLY